MTLSPRLYRTVYPWYGCDPLYSVIFSLSNIDYILTRTRVLGFALNNIPYGISIGADTVHSVLFHERWLKAQPTYTTYSKKVRPGLTERNRLRQVAFARHVFDNWNVSKNTKILWTMSDEKWWYGFVLRTFAKMYPALGINKEVFTCHHKKHIGK
jgi:hypothetical protein